MQFLCVAGPLATPYPLCLPELPGHCTWEGGREGRGEGGPRSGFLQDQDTAAASTRQRLESYICGICEPAPGCILVTGHHSVSKTRGSISPKPRPQMTSGSAFWEYCECVYCDIVNIGCWKLQTWAVDTEIYWSDLTVLCQTSFIELFQKESWNLFRRRMRFNGSIFSFGEDFIVDTSCEDGCWHGCQSYLCHLPENILV